MSYNHLTLTERARIEVLRQENYSLRSIARKLKRSVSTISREISRNNVNQSYQAETAQKNMKPKENFVVVLLDLLQNLAISLNII
ncbi:transposase [Staphylococcus aureus]|nr:transposase [Staphylococcus aureus]SGU02535.1 transposase [Staphylococcus aureus]SGU69382.1 transposase [Staphylococcus aureus]